MKMNDIAEKAASNAWFTILGRTAMLGTVALVGWLLQSVGALQTDVKVLTNTVNFSMTDRYRGDDAKRDFQLRDLKLEALAARLSDIEHEVRANKLDIKQQELK